MSDADRLFVPLMTEHFRNFENGSKQWELRGVNNQFNADTVRIGRSVELRRGYSTPDSLWGVIAAREFIDDPSEIFYHDLITPGKTTAEFRRSVDELLRQYDRYVAFRVELDGNGGDDAE